VREHVAHLSKAREITSDFGADYAQHIGEQNLLDEGCRYASLVKNRSRSSDACAAVCTQMASSIACSSSDMQTSTAARS